MTQYNRQTQGRPSPSRFGYLENERPTQGRPSQQRRSPQPTRRPPNPPRQGGSAPSRGPVDASSGTLPRGFLPLVGVCALIIVAGLLLQGLLPNGFMLTDVKDLAERPVAAQVSEIHGEGPIRLNEIMSANGGVLVDDSGKTPDWVEVANISSRPVNLRGYVLAKNAKAGNVFVFPDLVLEAGQAVVVYADSTLQDEDGSAELHAPFRLSSGGDVLMLFNDADVAVDTVNIPALPENTAYARVDRDHWAVSEQPTPGMLNTEENYQALTSVVQNSPMQLAEIVASNSKLRPDASGVVYDYVMLRNTSGDAMDIGGWYLSDTPRLPRLWKFPQGVVVPGGGTLVVYCSGLNRVEDSGHLHTSFRLSSEGETVTLSNAQGQPVDSATYDLLRTDEAYVRGSDGSWSVSAPAAEQ